MIKDKDMKVNSKILIKKGMELSVFKMEIV
jgi:hypothetical protein